MNFEKLNKAAAAVMHLRVQGSYLAWAHAPRRLRPLTKAKAFTFHYVYTYEFRRLSKS